MRRRLLLLTLSLGCSTDPVRPAPDATATLDASAEVDAGATLDASPRDAAAPLDAGSDDSLRGTSLEGITIPAEQTLELCSVWREGRSVDEERADQAHVTLRPHIRASLGRAHLEAARLPGSRVRRSPFANDHRDLDEVPAVLERYALTDPAGDARLEAELSFDLGGLGLLRERYVVTRARDDRAPVRLGERAFWLDRPGGHETVPLAPCAGPEHLEDAAELITAEGAGRTLSIVRFLRTRPAVAGSSPVVLTSAWVSFSDRPWERFTVNGYFAQTYAAGHHNWGDESWIDLERDLSSWSTIFEPHRAGRPVSMSEAPRRIRFRDLNSSGSTASIDVDWVSLPGDAERTERFTTTRLPVRVDATHVGRGLEQRCPQGSVRALYTSESIFQLAICPRAGTPNFSLDRVVPVVLPHEPSAQGVVIEGSSFAPITEMGRAGYRATFGGLTMTITYEAPYYWVAIHRGAQELTSSLGALTDLADRPNDDRLDFESADGAVQLEMVRRWVGQGAGNSSVFAASSLTLTLTGTRHAVDAWDRLAYENTHHNWLDSVVARTDALEIRWRTSHDLTPPRYYVRAQRRSDGAEVLAETELVRR